MSYRIVVSDSKIIDLDAGQTVFADIDATLKTTDARTPEALLATIGEADALIVDAGTQVTERVLTGLDSVQVVGRSGIGVDNVDVQAAHEHDITVVNVPDYCLDEVSAHALAMLLSCARKLPTLDRSVRSEEWDWNVASPVYRIQGQTVGLVGFGKIARHLTAKLRGFGVDMLVYDPYISTTDISGFAVTQVGFDRLLAESDFVSIHAPLTDETQGMFDADAFEMMPDHAIVVNTARGPIIDEEALCDALASDRVAGAGLDVRETEPPDDTRLFDFENVILSPHAGFYSEASRRELTHTVSKDVVRVLQGDTPENPVESGIGWH
jgi:D-3-phosphoglycerate dehydrogenase